jgi:hypothetical protein
MVTDGGDGNMVLGCTLLHVIVGSNFGQCCGTKIVYKIRSRLTQKRMNRVAKFNFPVLGLDNALCFMNSVHWDT